VERFIDRLAGGYAAFLTRVLPLRRTIIALAVVLVTVSVVVAAKLPSTFFPDTDEAMETIYVRFAPGISIEDSSKLITAMGKTLSAKLPKGSTELVYTNIGSPANARAIITSPNWGPHMGYLRVQFSDVEDRKQSQRELSDLSRKILNDEYPGVQILGAPGGLVSSVFLNGAIAPLVIEVRGDSFDVINEQAKAVGEVMRGVPGIRDVRVSLEMDYPELHVDVERTEAGMVGVSARNVGQTTLEATLGNINTPSVWIDSNNGQSYYVVTSYDSDLVKDPSALATLPVLVSDSGKPVTLGAYSVVRRAAGPIAVERNKLRRAVHILAQVEGRDLGTVASDLDKALQHDPRTAHVRYDFVGQVGLMRTTFGGLGVALALAVMVVFMIMASQFKSLRLPFIMLFTIPVSLVGIVAALLAAGQGFSITALMGVLMVIGIAVSNGILLVDDAARRYHAGATRVESIVAAARSRFVPIVMTSLATVIGLIPTAAGLEAGTEANQPLALAVVGGLTSSTVLSLFLVPVIYLLLAKRDGSVEDDEQATVGQA
ncbi:MAG TPA: efflux RND transporter permease subunit, partial [Polyangia bacterium]|nr:efflux RND transporter permease subunit [Polyangia bacterium]